MEKHTQEPWQSFQSDTEFFHVVDSATQTVLADLVPRGMGAAGNAARIVASVNACEGIPTERLQPWAVKTLIDALEWIAECGTDLQSIRKAQAALAPFKGAQEVRP